MLEKFLTAYQNLTKDNLAMLHKIYTADVTFIDPAHSIQGIDTLSTYFAKLYQNIDTISFDYADTLMTHNTASIYWTMSFTHPKINNGNTVTVEGNTFLRFHDDGMIFYHRDFFDLGAMLYEYIPVLGYGVRAVKKRLASQS